jgi:hypothetical protein
LLVAAVCCVYLYSIFPDDPLVDGLHFHWWCQGWAFWLDLANILYGLPCVKTSCKYSEVPELIPLSFSLFHDHGVSWRELHF